MKNIISTLCLLTMVLQTESGWGSSNSGPCGPIKVTTQNTVFSDVIKRIGGDSVVVKTLLHPLMSTHVDAVYPTYYSKLRDADMVIYTGDSFDTTWMALAMSYASPKSIVRANFGMNRIADVHPDADPFRGRPSEHPEGVPNFWLDPENVLVMAEKFYFRLKEVLPDCQTDFEANLNNFRFELDEKIQEWQKDLGPYQSRSYGIYSETFLVMMGYFKNFGHFELKEFHETEPNKARTEKMIDKMKRAAAKVVLFAPWEEPSKNFKKNVAKAIGGVSIELLLTPLLEEGPTSNYIGMMDFNVKTLKEAFMKTAGGAQ